MFLSFDESVLDLEDIGQSSCFFDGGKCLIDDLHVPLIVVNKFHFFLIVDDQLSESVLQHSSGIVLNSINLASLDPTSPIQLRILQFFVEFGQSSVVIGLILLILHLETEH